MVESYLSNAHLFQSRGYSIERLNIAPCFRTGLSPLDNLVYIFTQRISVRKRIRNSEYHIIHIHTSREFLFLKDILLAKMIKRCSGIPIVITVHVGAMETVYNRIKWFRRESITILNQFVNHAFFLSEQMMRQFLSEGLDASRSSVLYNFHCFEHIKDRIQHKESPIELLFVGAIHKEKGILELLSAISKLSDCKYHLSICGTITDNSIIQTIDDYISRLGDKVSLCGYVEGIEKTKLFLNSDLLILPSYHEGLPLVILEALGAGCAVMATRVGAIPEILSEENCFWVDIGSVDSIIEHLKNVTRKELEIVQKTNLNLGRKFTLSMHVDKLVNAYNTVIDEKNSYSH